MTDSPPSKRQRTDTDAPSAAATPVRSSIIWKTYGDIVLQAESTQFRISRDILATQSPVFHDMFSVPQPVDQPTIDGCSVVQVFGDTAKDWELLLHALYEPFRNEDALPFNLIAAMLRLGRKYAMDTIRSNAVARIDYDYPTDFALWDQRGVNGFVKIRSVVTCDLLNLVYECGMKASLPGLAFDCLNSYSMEHLMNNEIRRKDGSPVILANPLKLMLAVAAERLLKHQTTSFEWLDHDGKVIPSVACASKQACKKQRQKIFRTVTRGVEDWRYFSLSPWEAGGWSNKLCRACDAAGKANHNLCNTETWHLLPTFFGLPKWDELKDDD